MSGKSRLVVLAGHADTAYALAFSPDGRLLASGDAQGWVYLWDLAGERKPRILRRPQARPSRAWDRPDDRSHRVLPTNIVVDLVFILGGTRLAVAMAWGGLELWDVATGRRARRVPDLCGPLALDDDGIWAWTHERDRLVCFDPRTGEQTREVTLDPPADAGGTVGEGPRIDTRLRRTAQPYDGELRVWDIDTGRLVVSVPVPESPKHVGHTALSPDGRHVAVRTDRGATSRGDVWVLALDDPGRLPVCVARGDVGIPGTLVWTDEGLIVPQPEAVLRFDPDGAVRHLGEGRFRTVATKGWRIVGAEEGGRIRWLGGPERSFPTTLAEVRHLAFTPDGATVVSAHADGVVRAWSLSTGALLRATRGPPGKIVALHPDGTFAANNDRGATIVWDVATGEVRLAASREGAYPSAWALAGTTVAVGGRRPPGPRPGWLAVWDFVTGALRYERAGLSAGKLALDRDAELLAVAAALGRGPVAIVTLATGETTELAGRPSWWVSLAFSPNRDRLVLGEFGFSIDVRSLAEPDRVTTIRPHGDSLEVAVSIDGRVAGAPGYDPDVLLHDPATGITRALAGHRGPTRCVAFSPDGRLLASGARDGAVVLWAAASGRRVVTFQVLPGGYDWVTHTPGGAYVASPGSSRFLADPVPEPRPEAVSRGLLRSR